MSKIAQTHKRIPRLSMMAVVFGIFLSLVSCNTSKPPESSSDTGPKTFATPADAGAALLAAAKAGDRNTLLTIFGPGSADLIFSGDDAQDKHTGEQFTNAYQTMNRWRTLPDGTEVLLVGADNNPFPIPLKKNSAGQWYFDTAAGKEEILSRRIGSNELAAIDVLTAMADAQAQYISQHHDGVRQYAQKFISDEGKQNGLYWKSAEGQPRSPLGPLAAYASSEGFNTQAGKPQPFHGYFYRILTKQGADAKGGVKDYISGGKMTGGFAIIAFPEKYDDTGIMSFMINQSGLVYEKNLGKNTTQAAIATTQFNPDNSWVPVPE